MAIQSPLPPAFEDSFKKQKKSNQGKRYYEFDCYHTLVKHCGTSFTFEQLVQFQHAQMRKWTLYQHQGFIDCIRDFQCYEDYMLSLYSEIKNNTHFAQKVAGVEQKAYTLITQEGSRIHAQRETKRAQEAQALIYQQQQQQLACNNQQRKSRAQTFFNQQASDIEQYTTQWHDTHPDRCAAYQQTIATQRQCTNHLYALSVQAQTCVTHNGHNLQNYNSFDGNALQQQLHREIVTGIEKVAALPPVAQDQPFNQMMQSSSIDTFDDARRANVMGDCLSACKLIDLANTMVDCCVALVQGVVEGAIHGTADAITGTYHMIRHPLDTLQALGKVALKLAELIHDYVPLYKPPFLCTTEQEKRTAQQYHDDIARNWSEANQQLSQWWDETPAQDKIYEITKGTTHLLTNIIIGNKCLDLVGKLSKIASTEAVMLYKNVHPKALTTAGVQADVPAGFMLFSDAENVVQAPATVLLGKVEATSQLIEYGKKFELSTEQVTEALFKLEAEGGSVEKFYQATQKLENVPGIEKNIDIIFGMDNKGNLRGAFFELESGLQAIDFGENVMAINKKFFGREIDIVTDRSFIECKNWNWSKIQDITKCLDKLKADLGSYKKIAMGQNKKMILHSKHPLPPTLECNELRNWLIKQEIKLIEG